MTSIISSICALAMLYVVAGTSSRYRIGERLFIGGLGMIVLVAAVGVMFLGNAMDLGKLLGLVGRSGDFTGRTEIWIEAIKAIVARPWVGWGFDDNAYLIKTTGMLYATYHNGYLNLMVHGGAIALGLFFLLLGNWLYQVTKRTRVGSDIVPFAIPFVVSMLVYNLMEATLVEARNPMWLIFLVILFLGACKKMAAVGADSRFPEMAYAPNAACGVRLQIIDLFPLRSIMKPSGYLEQARQPLYQSFSHDKAVGSMAGSSTQSRQVVIVERRLPHYRVPFFESFAGAADARRNRVVVAGRSGHCLGREK